MTKIVTPTLSTRGWLKVPENIIDNTLNSYLAANPSQTLMFNGNVVSLQYAIYITNNKARELSARVKSDLDKVFAEYSKVVEIEVKTKEKGPEIELYISGIVEIDGKRYDFARSLDDIDSMFVKVNDVEKTS